MARLKTSNASPRHPNQIDTALLQSNLVRISDFSGGNRGGNTAPFINLPTHKTKGPVEDGRGTRGIGLGRGKTAKRHRYKLQRLVLR